MIPLAERFLGRLLQLANSNPDAVCRSDFYSFKDRLLSRFGRRVGRDLQHIKKTCWTCGGTGTFTGYDSSLGWVDRRAQPCLRCSGGVYQEFWVVLDRFDLGGGVFHRPVERVWLQSRVPRNVDDTIEGYINHLPVESAVAAEAFLRLALIFDVGLYFRLQGKNRFRRPRLPLIWIADKVYLCRRLIANIRLSASRLRWGLRDKLSAWKRKDCPADDLTFDDLPF